LVSGQELANTVAVLLGQGDGSFGPAQTYPVTYANEIALGDMNADGNLDIVAANAAIGETTAVLGNGDGTFRSPTTFLAGGDGVVLADFNRDGRLDASSGNYVLLQSSVAISPTSVSFGVATLGQASKPQTVTVSNVGSKAISFTSISITGSGFSFTQTN